MSYSSGDVILVDLEPTIGSEQGFKRPCIIVSNLATITASNSRVLYMIVPLTRSQKLIGKLAPRISARAGGLPADSTALIMHLRSIDPARIIKYVGRLEADEMQLIREGLQELFSI
jgi:mRNA interferase MazF